MPVVYVLCPDLKTPFGGVMKLYEVVDTLNANGIESYIIHDDKNFKAEWFENSTKITDFKSVVVKEDDLLIIPEVYGNHILKYYTGVRKIIFNQNSFYTLMQFKENISYAKEVYLHKDIAQVMVVSDHDYNFIKWLFPTVRLSRITLGINSNLFFYAADKKKQIAVMPRKVANDYNLLVQLLILREDLQEYTIKVIDNLSLENVAEILRESEIFLSFSHQESFGLPPAEAMACGCIVIGYHGQGGKEFFKADLTYPIEQSNLMDYTECVGKVIKQFETNPLKMQEIGRQASQFILNQYSKSNQEKSILTIVRQFIS